MVHLATDVDVSVFVQQGSDYLHMASSDGSNQHGLPTLEPRGKTHRDGHIRLKSDVANQESPTATLIVFGNHVCH